MADFATNSRASSENGADNIDPDDWVSTPFSLANPLHQGLKDLEEKLLCFSCKEIMKVPMLLIPCHHTFCSLCIRNWAKTKAASMKTTVTCPFCRENIQTGDISNAIKPNSSLEAVIIQYKNIRTHLMKALSTSTTTNEPVASLESKEVPPSGKRKRAESNYAEMGADDDDSENYKCDNNSDAAAGWDDHVEVLQPRNGNQKEASAGRASSCAALERKAKPFYNKLKKKELQKLCKDDGLPQSGTEAELKARHASYIYMYNAECDSINPREPKELAALVLKEERARKAGESKSKKEKECMEKLKKNAAEMGKTGNSSGAGIAMSGNRTFDEKLQQNFTYLIEQARAAKNNKPAPSPSSAEGKVDVDAVQNPEKINDNASPAAAGLPSSLQKASTTTTTTPKTIENPYKRPRSSTASKKPLSQALGVAEPFSVGGPGVQTPQVAPDLFSAGSQPPSTISHKQSQSSLLPLTQDTVERVLGSTKDRSSSPLMPDAVKNSYGKNSATNGNVLEDGGDGACIESLTDAPVNTNRSSKAKGNAKPPRKTAAVAKTKTTRTTNAAPVPAPAPTRRSGRSIVGPWTCPQCTFLNKVRTYSSARCEICNERRRAP